MGACSLASSWRVHMPPPEPQGQPSKNTSQAAFQCLVNGSAAWFLLRSLCCPPFPASRHHVLPLPYPWLPTLAPAAGPFTSVNPTGECQDLTLWHPLDFMKHIHGAEGTAPFLALSLITLTLVSNGYLSQVCRELGFSERLSPLHSSDVGAPSCPGCSSSQPAQRLCSTCRSGASHCAR